MLLTLELEAVGAAPALVQETVDVGVEEAVVGEDLVEVDVVVDVVVGLAGHDRCSEAEQQAQQGRGHDGAVSRAGGRTGYIQAVRGMEILSAAQTFHAHQ